MLNELALDEWTDGACRAVERAARIASWRQAAEVNALHLLAALMLDEGRAAGRLATQGLSPGRLLVVVAPDATAWPDDVESYSTAVPWSRDASTLLHEAQAQALRQSGIPGVGTDHILWSLVHIASSAGEILADHGLTPEIYAPAPVPAVASAPIAMPEGIDVELAASQPPPLFVLWRLIDASANRAREALRVIEDYTRFVLNDAFLSRELKQARHDFTDAMRFFPSEELLASRDTIGDVGTTVSTPAEYQRTGITAVLTAAFKRLQEALRSIEEYTKAFDGVLSQRFEALRYRTYTLEKAVLRSQFNSARLANQRVYLLVTDALCPLGAGRVIHEALAAGVRIIQIREKAMSDRQLIAHCRNVRKWTRSHDALMIVNDRPDIAAMVEADGVHLGQEECTVADARMIVGPERLIGVSTHTIEQARQAVLDGADYLGVGPTFPTTTKDFAEFPGLAFVNQVAQEIALPWFAIGGITLKNIDDVMLAGAQRFAVSSAICSADNPRSAAVQFFTAIGGSPSLSLEEDDEFDE